MRGGILRGFKQTLQVSAESRHISAYPQPIGYLPLAEDWMQRPWPALQPLLTQQTISPNSLSRETGATQQPPWFKTTPLWKVDLQEPRDPRATLPAIRTLPHPMPRESGESSKQRR